MCAHRIRNSFSHRRHQIETGTPTYKEVLEPWLDQISSWRPLRKSQRHPVDPITAEIRIRQASPSLHTEAFLASDHVTLVAAEFRRQNIGHEFFGQRASNLLHVERIDTNQEPRPQPLDDEDEARYVGCGFACLFMFRCGR